MAASVRVQLGAALGERRGAPPDAGVRRMIGRAARAALRHERTRSAEISITLLDDTEIAALNDEFLSHSGPTDVISFPLFGEGEDPVGDIYIGYDQAVRQASANGVAVSEELARLAVHGVLHVLGYDHPDGRSRLDSDMWRVQEAIVAQVMA
ncbi:MAG TPA: rRNA maturation RNase YbeY [Longimicrobiales bacterium]